MKLGKLLSISESSGSIPYAADVIRAPATGGGVTESPIQAGELTVRINGEPALRRGLTREVHSA